jgi:protein-L-isoaspartate(D-aspartate) O-methyltransferase
MDLTVEQARQCYAEELRFTAHLRSMPVVDAFAAVPREHFLGPGPWRIKSPWDLGAYRTTVDADPRHLYHDVLVAIEEKRGLNNGQPGLWAFLFDQLALDPGARVVHVGAGVGYYSAILAEIVGPAGEVTAIEVDPDLAARAAANLAARWPQARVLAADGFAFRPGRPADVIVVNAGVSHIAPAWLDALDSGTSRVLFPLTNARGRGGYMLIERRAEQPRCCAARLLTPVTIFDCVGGRDSAAVGRLDAAFKQSGLPGMHQVKSLRRAPDLPDASCWLAGEGWWLSTASPDALGDPA